MGKPLKDPPVFLTLAQVKFNPVLTLSEFLPTIQEHFRKAGFPDFESQSGFAIKIPTDAPANKESSGGALTPESIQLNRFLFGNIERTHLFVLDKSSLTLQSTNYGHFESFSKCFSAGLTIVNDALKISYIDRIGLRYLDRVMPIKGKTVNDYLIETVRGAQSKLGGNSIYSYTESMNKLDDIQLISRVAIQNGALLLPPDLQIGKMLVEEKFLKHVGENATLDNDGFIEKREPFKNNADILERLDAIHTVINAAFKKTVTKEALKIWG